MTPMAYKLVDAFLANNLRLFALFSGFAAVLVYRRLALMLGRAHGVDLPWGLSSRLPAAFASIMGGWSQETLDAQEG